MLSFEKDAIIIRIATLSPSEEAATYLDAILKVLYYQFSCYSPNMQEDWAEANAWLCNLAQEMLPEQF